MGLLNPLLLLAGLGVAVPLILHLFHHHDARRLRRTATDKRDPLAVSSGGDSSDC